MTAAAEHSVVPRPFQPVHRPRSSRFLGFVEHDRPASAGRVLLSFARTRTAAGSRCSQSRTCHRTASRDLGVTPT